MKKESLLSAETIGKIALIQGMVAHLPDKEQILRFVCHGLEEVPGVRTIDYCLPSNQGLAELPSHEDPNSLWILPLQFGGCVHGELLVSVSDEEVVSPYKPFLENLANMLSVIFEERRQRNLHTKLLDDLEERIAKRTQELECEIEGHKKAEAALRESEERFSKSFESSSTGMYMVGLDGRFLLVNTAFSEMLGYTKTELLSRTFGEVTYPDDANRSAENLERLFRGEIDSFEDEKRYLRKDGTTFLASIKVSSVRDGKGVLQHYFKHVTDITKQREDENALKRSEQKLKAIFQQNFHFTGILDIDGTLTDVNNIALRFAGIEKSDVIGKLFWETPWWTHSPELQEKLRQSVKRACDGEFINFEATHPAADGSLHYIDFSLRPVFDESGKISFLVPEGRDITERKQIERELQKSEEKYRNLIELMPDGLLIHVGGKIVFANIAAAKLLGADDPERLVGKKVLDFVHPDFQNIVTERVRQITEGNTPAPILEEKLVRADGVVIDSEVTAIPFQHYGKDAVQVVFRDITERKRTEDALKRNELFTRSIVDNEPECVKIVERGGKLRYMNPAGLAMIGVDNLEDMKGRSVYQIVVPEHRQAFIELTENVFRGERGTLEFEIINIKGVRRWLTTHAVPLFDEKGNVESLLGLTTDITERKQAELLLRESEDRYRSLFDKMLDGVYRSSHSGKFIDVNPTMVKMFGYESKEEMLQIDIAKDLYFEPSDRDHCPLNSVQEKTRVFRMRKKDGSEIWVEDRGHYIFDEQGNILIHEGVLRDVTERIYAEDALRKSEETYRLIADNATDVIWVLDAETETFRYMSPSVERLLGYTDNEFVNRSLTQTATSSSLEYIRKVTPDRIHNMLKGVGKYYRDEIEVVHKDGRVILTEITMQFVRNTMTGRIEATGVMRDMTERVQAEEKQKSLETQLQQAQKLESLGTLASGIAHDFNNILGIIIGHASLLECLPPESETIKKNTDAIIKAGSRGASLVKQLLTFARKTEVFIESVQLNDVVAEVSKLLYETFPKTIPVVQRLEKPLPFVIGDATQINQIILNLCVNARDAMSEGGTLTVETFTTTGEIVRRKFQHAESKEYVGLRVSDTGVGMDEATRKRIFEPFFTTKDIGKGTGLGLSLVFGIVERHHGFIDVQSEPGKGATFEVYLPVPLELISPQLENVQNQEAAIGGNETILVIEDEELLRGLVKSALASKGYKIITAVDGEEGVARYLQYKNNIHAVVSDFGLPKLNGFDVFMRMKELNPGVRFVLASGFVDPDIKAKMLAAGMKEIIQKPFSLENLLHTVRNILDLK